MSGSTLELRRTDLAERGVASPLVIEHFDVVEQDLLRVRVTLEPLRRLVRVAATGGQPENYGVESSILPRPGPLTSFDLSPDGSRAAFSVRTTGTFNVTVVENVMSGFRGITR